MTMQHCPKCKAQFAPNADGECPYCRQRASQATQVAQAIVPSPIAELQPQIVNDQTGPRLWNPNAAANGCILFTPAFGAFLHAANWKELGNRKLATANTIWAWITVIFLLAVSATFFLPPRAEITLAVRIGGIAILATWYFGWAKPHATYIREQFGDNYQRKGWAIPLLAGVACMGAYIAVMYGLAVYTYKPDMEILRTEVKSAIVEHFKQDPAAKRVRVKELTLEPVQGKEYSGTVKVSENGNIVTMKLNVTVDATQLFWELEPLPD